MKIKAVIASAVVILLGIGLNGWSNATASDRAASSGTPGKKQTVCPVMGGAINTNIYVDHEGKRIYFCCGGCPAEFKKNPKKYIAQLEAANIVLDQAGAK